MKEGLKGLKQIITGIGGLVIGILFVMALMGAFDDEAEEIGNAEIFRGNDASPAFSDEGSQMIVTESGEVVGHAAEEKESADKKEEEEKNVVTDEVSTDIDAMLPETPDYDEYLHLGSVFTNESGVTIEVIDVDYKVFNIGTSSSTDVYIAFDITNNSDESFWLDQNDAVLYIDDYEMSKGAGADTAMANGYYIGNGNVSYPTAVTVNAGGRKGQIVFTAMINSDKVDEDSEIDFEIAGLIFKVNPLVILGKVDTSDKDVFGDHNDTENITDSGDTNTGIGNPIIDANPDRYVLTDGIIDAIDDGFYADSGNIDLVPGEYLITGGNTAILTVAENTISMSGGKNNFENAEIRPAENGSPQYWVYVDGGYYAVVSFFEGGLYFRTYEADSDEDWDEGFYSIL